MFEYLLSLENYSESHPTLKDITMKEALDVQKKIIDLGFTDKDIVEEHGAVKVVVDMKSMLFLADAVIDYKDGLMDAGFTINIPSAKNSCGCGDSFAM